MYRRWFYLALALALSVDAKLVLADGQGHGHERQEDRQGDDDDRDHGYYREHADDLPPGLARRDALPPGLERQLRVRGTLPPGLQRRMRPCPVEVERFLPPPPPGYTHTVIGGHIVLVNPKTYFVLDVFHFEF